MNRNEPPLYMPARVSAVLGARGRTVVGNDGELKVEQVGRVGEMSLHRRGQVQLGEVCSVSRGDRKGASGAPFCTRIWAAETLGFRFACASSAFFMDQI